MTPSDQTPQAPGRSPRRTAGRTSGKWVVPILLVAIAAVALVIRWGVTSQAAPYEDLPETTQSGN